MPKEVAQKPRVVDKSTYGTNPVESLLFKYFRQLPPAARVIAYFLFLVAFLHNYVRPTVISGNLTVRSADGVERLGSDYIFSTLENPGTISKLNASGGFMVYTNRLLPGAVWANVHRPVRTADPQATPDANPEDEFVGHVKLPMPIPLVSSLFSAGFVRLIFDEATRTFSVAQSQLPSLTAPVHAIAARRKMSSEPRTGDTGAAQPGAGPVVQLKRLEIKETGDAKRGELFFELKIDGNLHEPYGLPARKYRNTFLMVNKNSKIDLPNMSFRVPRISSTFASFEFEMRVFDWDPCILCFNNPDDLVGWFKRRFTRGDIGRDIEVSSTTPLPHGRGPDNAKIAVRLVN